MCTTVELTQQLIRCHSVTPEDAGCQHIIIAHLKAIGFEVERLRFGAVANFWARRGRHRPLFAFAGHTDVVPTGPVERWRYPPFAAELHDGWLYGRGAADMKGSLAAMVTACERFVKTYPDHRGSIGFLITSDEEGPAQNGTIRVIEHLQNRGERIDWCLVGEPTSSERLGDTIKNGRRGSLHGTLRLNGVQGHVAYPHRVQNPIHASGAIITALVDEVWDQGDTCFPPTSFQITNIHAGTGADNVAPGEVDMLFNFRFSTAVSVESLKERVRRIIDTQLLNEEVKHHQIFSYDLHWKLSALPFLTSSGELVATAMTVIREQLGIEAQLSTSGGTSDGRFIAPTGAQVIELGPVNASIHQIDERLLGEDLEKLSRLYENILVKLLA
jgi:succinyl-diaminopimelate desuccinylase